MFIWVNGDYLADHADRSHAVLGLGCPVGNEAVLAVERLGSDALIMRLGS
jgi:hypothetical protein